ncbi:MAG: C25 family cysteine peptidase [Anaerolineales bacterium]|nr:C25 family cysteine peptidase [Anaerolineales bacterium]
MLGFAALCLAMVWLGLDVAAPARAQSPTSTPAQLRLVQSDANRVVMELEVPTYTTQARNLGGVNYVALSIPGLGNTSAPGKPQLPVKGAMIGIPPGAVASLKILADDSARVKLNAPPIPAPTQRPEYDLNRTAPRDVRQVIVPDAATYSANRLYPIDAVKLGTDSKWRSQRYLTIQFYPLQYNGATRELTFHRRLRVEITFTYPRGQTREALGGSVNEGTFEPTLKNMLLNYDSAQAWRAKTVAPGARAPKSTRAGEPMFRIAVNTDGMYKISCAQLQAQGASPSLDPNTLKVYKKYDQTDELRIYQVWQTGDPCDSDHYIVFWGQGLNTKYTDTNAYWLTYGGANGRRVIERPGNGSGTAATEYTQTIHLEDNRYYLSTIPETEGFEHWYWQPLSSAPTVTSFPVSNLPATPLYSATLSYKLVGFTTLAHQHQIRVNAYTTPITDFTWSGKGPVTGTVSFPANYLTNGSNSISVVDVQSGSTTVSDNYDLAYGRTFVAMTDTLRFRQPASGAWQYTITNFTTSTLQAFDIADPLNVARIVTPTISGSAPYSYQFADNQPTAREYIALAASQYKTPVSITLDTAGNLKGTNGADYIVIAYDGFISNIQPLKTLRESQIARVKVVGVQDVYDEFNDGVLDPQAIRDFLAYAYTSWTPPVPSMVLLVGDAHFDPRGYCVTAGKCPQDGGMLTPPNSTYIPAPLRIVDTHRYESADDNFFVAFNDGTGDLMPQMALGRLPANSAAEVDTMVTKLKMYEESTPSGTWRARVTFVSDNAYNSDGTADGAGNFWAYSDAVAGNSYYLPTSYQVNRVYYNPCDPNTYPQCALPYPYYTTTDEVHTATLAAINTGSAIVNYVGHGSMTQWAHSFFANADVDTLTNGYKLPVVLDMTCDTGFYTYPTQTLPGVGEKNLRRAGNGALAVWGATAWGFASGHDYLDRGFFESVFHNGERRIGPATIAGKALLWAGDPSQTDAMKMFILLGDPASRLQLQAATYLPLILR